MAARSSEIMLSPIGFVRNGFESSVPEGYEDMPSRIEINPEFAEALDGLEKNSHIIVLFWLHGIKEDARTIKKLHPKGREDLPLVGVLATRSPRRPNPIGLRAVRLAAVRDNILEVVGLDAYNGSPVLDIKPYSVKHDMVPDARVPPWIKQLNGDKRD